MYIPNMKPMLRLLLLPTGLQVKVPSTATQPALPFNRHTGCQNPATQSSTTHVQSTPHKKTPPIGCSGGRQIFNPSLTTTAMTRPMAMAQAMAQAVVAGQV